MVEDVCWPEPSSLSPPPPSCSNWGWYHQWWSLPHIEKLQKLFLWWGLPHTSFLCLLMLLLVLNFLPQSLQTNTWPLCCNIVWCLGVGKDLKALSQTLQWWTLYLSCALSTETELIQQQHELPHKPPSTPAGPGASRWAPLFMCSLKLILVLKVM